MKAPKILTMTASAMVIAVMALIGVVGMNMTQTVDELDIALTEVDRDTVIARTSDDELTDPSGLGYVAPLGENKTTAPDESKTFAVAVGVQGKVIGLLAVCLLVVTSLGVRYWRRDRSLEEWLDASRRDDREAEFLARALKC